MDLGTKAVWQLEFFEEKLPGISEIEIWIIKYNKPYPYPSTFNNYKDAIAFIENHAVKEDSVEEVGIGLFNRIRHEKTAEEV
jgi:hypothetical protein